jgi:hypothetical protein
MLWRIDITDSGSGTRRQCVDPSFENHSFAQDARLLSLSFIVIGALGTLGGLGS